MASAEALVRRVLELTDRQDWAGREALFTEDCVLLTPMGEFHGRAATTAFSAPLVAAFGEAAHRVDAVLAEGDLVGAEGVWIATHTGPLATPDGEVPATGRTIELAFAAVGRMAGDRLRSFHVYFDQLSFLGQLGLVPQPAAA